MGGWVYIYFSPLLTTHSPPHRVRIGLIKVRLYRP
nr:MAG TPA: hypothetical protein [Caudoviricetes sp.]